MKSKFLFTCLLTLLYVTTFSQAPKNSSVQSLEWKRLQSIDNSLILFTGNGFGYSVDIDGDQAVVGDFRNRKVYYYEKDVNNIWQERQIIFNPLGNIPSSAFGMSICLKNNVLFIGDPYISLPLSPANRGLVFVYAFSGSWSHAQTLAPTIGTGFRGSFGVDISFDNDILVIGDNGYQNSIGQIHGSAFIFLKIGSQWVEKKLILNPSLKNDQFGNSVSLTGNRIAVGAPDVFPTYSGGNVYTYLYNKIDNELITGEVLQCPTPATHDRFGYELKFLNDDLLVGARKDPGGSIFCFNKIVGNELNFDEGQRIDEVSYYFGTSIDFDENSLVVGARFEYTYGTLYTGATYIYHKVGTQWEKMQKEINYCYSKQAHNFGNCVALSGNQILIGAPDWTTEVTKDSKSMPSSVFFYKQEISFFADAGPDQKICPGETIVLGAQPDVAKGGNGEYKYFWTDNNGWTSALEHPVVSPTVTTTYSVCVTDCNGIGNTVCDEVTITVGCQFPIRFSHSGWYSGGESLASSNDGRFAYCGVNRDILTINNKSYNSNVTATGDGDYRYVSQFFSSSCLNWLHFFTSDYSDEIGVSQRVEFDDNNNLYYLAGDLRNYLWSDIKPNSPPKTHNNIFFMLAKFDPNGTEIFEHHIENPNSHIGYGDIEITQNGVYILAHTPTSFVYNGHNVNSGHFIIKYSTEGIVEWVYSIPNVQSNMGYCMHLAHKPNGNLLYWYTFYNETTTSATIKILELSVSGTYLKTHSIVVADVPAVQIDEVLFDGTSTYFVNLTEGGNNINSQWDNKKIKRITYNVASDVFSVQNPDFITDNCEINLYPGTLPIGISGGNVLFFNRNSNCTPIAYSITSSDYSFQTNYNINIPNHFSTFDVKNNSSYGYYVGTYYQSTVYQYIDVFNVETGEIGCQEKKSKSLKSNTDFLKPESAENGYEYKIWPNPSTGIFLLSQEFIAPIDAELSVYNASGTKIYHTLLDNSSELKIDLSNYPDGLYYLRIINQGNLYSKKIIKCK